MVISFKRTNRGPRHALQIFPLILDYLKGFLTVALLWCEGWGNMAVVVRQDMVGATQQYALPWKTL